MTWRTARRVLPVHVLVVILTATPAAAGEGQCTINRFPDIPVTMRGLRPLVHAQINGTDALFLVDSGAFYSSVVPDAVPQLKMRLNYQYRVGVQGVGGHEQAQVAVAKTFGILGHTWSDVEFIVADVGYGGYGGEAVGLLGQNVFRLADVEYDLANGVIRWVVPKGHCKDTSLAYWAQQADKPYSVIDIEFATPTSPHTRSVAYLNGTKIRVIFDTGANGSVLTLAAAKRAGITPTSPGVAPGGGGRGIGYRTLKTWITHFASFKIGEEEIQHAMLRFGDLNLPDADMLIGSDFFLSHRIYVASSQRKLYFTYNGGPVFDLTTRTPASADAEGGAPGSPAAQGAAGATADGAPAPATTPNAPTASPNAPTASPNASTPTAAAAAAGAAAGAVASMPAKPDTTRADALLDKPTDAAGFSRRAAASVSRHDYPSALADLRRACELAPTEASYFYQRGMVYWDNKQADLALADFDRAIRLKPDDADALIARATLHASHHEPADVVAADLTAADRALPNEAGAHLSIGNAYADAGQPAAAVAQYSKWIDSHPRDERQMAAALNSRCWARALLGEGLDQALSDCNAALRLAPDRAAILDSRGLVHLRQGNYDKAIRDYDDALRLQPKSAWSLYGRGLAKLRKGMSAQGQADIAAAVALEPKIAERAGRYGIAQ